MAPGPGALRAGRLRLADSPRPLPLGLGELAAPAGALSAAPPTRTVLDTAPLQLVAGEPYLRRRLVRLAGVVRAQELIATEPPSRRPIRSCSARPRSRQQPGAGASGNGAIDIGLVRSLPERDQREKLWKVRQQRPFAETSW